MDDNRKDLITLLLFFEKHNLDEEVVHQMTQDGIYPPKTDAQFLAVEAILIPELSKRQKEIIESRRKPGDAFFIIPGA